MQSNTKHKALIYESANGITYAKYRDDSTIPRWVVGGNLKGWIPGTNIQCPEDWYEFKDVRPDFNLILSNPNLKDVYTKFLSEQKKYQVWEKLSGR